MDVTWTEEQQAVIDHRQGNLLVSAAAGSGKTAVLVERILSLVTDPEHPVDIDRLLVVTFTRAAAGEMKDRIGRALEERLLQDPENTSFCAGVCQSYSGPVYVAAGIYAKAGMKEAPSAESKERTFTLLTTDDALNCYGQLIDQDMEPEDPKELYKGEGYYYCIFNENAADENNKEELVGMFAESSDPEVVAIDANGEVTAKSAGTATLTVRPAKESAIEFVQEVEVH